MSMIRIRPEILSAFPQARIGVLILQGIDNSGDAASILPLLRSEEARQKELLATTELPSLPEIKAWREAYKTFGSDPRDFRPSVEALLRRARGGAKPLPHINPLVDLYNYISIKYHLPIGAEDLAKIVGSVELAFADGTETGVALGAQEPESCYPGEVIYRDEQSFLCRRWNWREADRTKIDETTRDALLVIDTVGGIGPEVLERALDETQALAERELRASSKRAVLDGARMEFSF